MPLGLSANSLSPSGAEKGGNNAHQPQRDLGRGIWEPLRAISLVLACKMFKNSLSDTSPDFETDVFHINC